jgi:hypothetical protein
MAAAIAVPIAVSIGTEIVKDIVANIPTITKDIEQIAGELEVDTENVIKSPSFIDCLLCKCCYCCKPQIAVHKPSVI